MFKENLKHNWGFIAISFLVYFLCGPFSIIFDLDSLTAYDIMTLLSVGNSSYISLMVVTSIIAASVTFSFLNRQNSVTAVHQLPFSRKELFVQNYFSGLLLAVIPAFLNGVVLFILKRPVYYDVYAESTDILSPQNAYTASAVIEWFLAAVVIICFTYSIAVLASSICGNNAVMVITAFVLNAIVPVFAYTFDAWGVCFLYGYSSSDFISSFACVTHPVLYFVQGDWVAMAIYLAVAALIAYCAYLFYKNRKLEKAGDSYVFGFVKWIAGFMFAYFPAIYTALLFDGVFDFVPTLVIGGLIGFIVGTIIINKSFRIFNLDTLKHFAIYGAIIAVITACFAIDVFGFENRMPKAEKVESAYLYGYGAYDEVEGYLKYLNTEDEELVRKVHSICIEAKEKSEGADDADCYDIWITYYMKNGRTISRCYNLPYECIPDEYLVIIQEEGGAKG